MSDYKGTTKVLVEQRESFSPERGYVTVMVWRGTDAELRAQQHADALAGFITQFLNREGVLELETTVPEPDRNPDGTATEQISDDWQISTQFVQAPIWGDDYLRIYIKNNLITTPDAPDLATVDAAISTYKATFEDHKKKFYKPDGTVDTERTGPTPLLNFKPKYHDNSPVTDSTELSFLKDFYDLTVIKGSDKVNAARVTLIRRRTLKATSAQRYQATGVNLAWEPSNLYSKFGVPTAIQALLPSVPTEVPPARTKWAWALTSQSAETSGTGLRVQERLEWAFAPVRLYTYKLNT